MVGFVYYTPLQPTYANDGDVWIDASTNRFHVQQNGRWNPAVLGSTGQPPQCHYTGTHVLSEVVRYTDGLIAAYCEHCAGRAVLPFQPGGLEAVRLRDLGAAILVDDTDSRLLLEFDARCAEMRAHIDTCTDVLREADVVRSVVAARREQRESSSS